MMGRKINALRKGKGLTLQQLGDVAGLSASFLSQVERGLTSPTVMSLAHIARALDVSPSYFFPPPRPHGPVVRSYERQPFRLQDGNVVYARLGADFDGRRLEPLMVTYPPRFESEAFSHEGEEFFYVVDGKVVLTIEDETFDLNAGDSMHFSSGCVHRVANPADAPAQLIYVNTPPYLD